jgi:hypothetical protein
MGAAIVAATVLPHLARPPLAAIRGLRIHRSVLQPPAQAFHPGHAVASQLRTAPALSARRLRTMARTRQNQHQQTNPQVSRKPGQVQAGPLLDRQRRHRCTCKRRPLGARNSAALVIAIREEKSSAQRSLLMSPCRQSGGLLAPGGRANAIAREVCRSGAGCDGADGAG